MVFLERRVRPTTAPVSDALWAESSPPRHGPGFVIADGFGSATRTSSVPAYEHLSRRLGPLIAQAIPLADICPFSYAGAGYAYEPADTNIRLSPLIAELMVSDYFPRPGIPLTYILFSMASPLFGVGFATRLDQRVDLDERLISESVNRLVMLQPALALTEGVLDELRHRRYALTPMMQLLDPAEKLPEAIARAISRLADLIPTTILYWKDDGFIDYSPAVITRLSGAHLDVQEFKLRWDGENGRPRVPNDDPFLRHAAVARHPDAHQEILRACGLVEPR